MTAIAGGRPRRAAFRATLPSSWVARTALAALALVVLGAIFGPFFAPHAPGTLVSTPFASPSGSFPFGTDVLGRDVLSRLLWGGRTLLWLSVLATGVAYVIGTAMGLFAGFSRSVAAAGLMRLVDLLLVFPPLLFLLVLVSGFGTSTLVLVVGIVVLHVPGIARIIYAASLETSVRGYVEAAVARGERLRYVLWREMLPNITGTIVADAGPRLTVSIFLLAGLNFLGLGVQPPAADWALMITENRPGIAFQPWAVAVPVIVIAVLTLAVNVAADAIAGQLGRSRDWEEPPA